MPVLLQNGQFYEARLRAPHCASSSGCRAVVEEANGNKVFNILENFMFTLKVGSCGMEEGCRARLAIVQVSEKFTIRVV